MSQEKMQVLLDEYGYGDEVEMMEEYVHESIVPGICMNEGCSATFEYEPDSEDGWCDACETGSVKSLLVLGGVM